MICYALLANLLQASEWFCSTRTTLWKVPASCKRRKAWGQSCREDAGGWTIRAVQKTPQGREEESGTQLEASLVLPVLGDKVVTWAKHPSLFTPPSMQPSERSCLPQTGNLDLPVSLLSLTWPLVWFRLSHSTSPCLPFPQCFVLSDQPVSWCCLLCVCSCVTQRDTKTHQDLQPSLTYR